MRFIVLLLLWISFPAIAAERVLLTIASPLAKAPIQLVVKPGEAAAVSFDGGVTHLLMVPAIVSGIASVEIYTLTDAGNLTQRQGRSADRSDWIPAGAKRATAGEPISLGVRDATVRLGNVDEAKMGSALAAKRAEIARFIEESGVEPTIVLSGAPAASESHPASCKPGSKPCAGAQQKTCCVTCSGVTACGDVVIHDCGNCGG